eukprot:COSAG02_NODE_13961_length_1326_cov_41.504482_2_plen_48_part_00
MYRIAARGRTPIHAPAAADRNRDEVVLESLGVLAVPLRPEHERVRFN